MMNQKYLLLISVILISSSFAKAAVLQSGGSKSTTNTPSDAQLLEELTGKKTTTVSVGVAPKAAIAAQEQKNLAAQPPSKLHLNAGYQAYLKKDYILALKHYNTVLAKYPKSSETRLTYMAKAKLYNEMGLPEQAQRNYKLAQQIAPQTNAKK